MSGWGAKTAVQLLVQQPPRVESSRCASDSGGAPPVLGLDERLGLSSLAKTPPHRFSQCNNHAVAASRLARAIATKPLGGHKEVVPADGLSQTRPSGLIAAPKI